MMPFFSLNTDYNQTGIFISMANVTPSQITIMMHGSIYCMVMAEFNQAGTTINVAVTDEMPSPYYLGKIEAEDGNFSGEDGSPITGN